MTVKKEVKLGSGPYVSPGMSPQAVAYAKQHAARAAIPKGGEQVAGGPTPPIPRLDRDPVLGVTMSDAARAQRGSILTPDNAPAQQAPYLLPSDLLPEQAKSDPGFMQGMGSMYATAQPGLAAKYGVMRQGQLIPPQKLFTQPGRPAAPGRLSDATIQDLKKLEQLRAEQAPAPPPVPQEKPIMPESQPVEPPELAPTASQVESTLNNMDEFDLESVREMLITNLFNNDAQRKIIEKRLQPMDLADLIINGAVTQRVPIVPGVYEPTYRSITGEEDLALKRMVVEEARALKIDDRHSLEKYTLMGLTCSLYAMNGTPLPSHLDAQGDFSPAAFQTKFKKVMRFPLPLLASLGAHYFFFDVRVRQLLVAANVKNG